MCVLAIHLHTQRRYRNPSGGLPTSSVEVFAEQWLAAPGPAYPTLAPLISPSPSLPTPPPAPTKTATPCVGSAPFVGASCVGGVWIVLNGYPPFLICLVFGDNLTHRSTVITAPEVTITPGQQVTINGSLTLLPIAITQISPDGTTAPIVVTGSVLLDGTLIVVLPSAASDGQIIPIISGSGDINGTFSEIDVISPTRCQRVTGTPAQVRLCISVVCICVYA